METVLKFDSLTPEEIQERLSAAVIHELRNVFNLYDEHNLGYIPKPDLRDMLSSIGYNLTNSMLDNLVAIVDVDNNGKIDFDEFIDLIANLETKEKHENDALAAFNTFDYKGDGSIQRADIRMVLDYVYDEIKETKNESGPLSEHSDDEMSYTTDEKDNITSFFRLNSSEDVQFEEFSMMINMMEQ